MSRVKFWIIRLISIIVAFFSSLFIFTEITYLYGDNILANIIIFIGSYFIISILIIFFWCYSLTDSSRSKLKSFDEATVPFMFFYFPITFIVSALYELLININKINATNIYNNVYELGVTSIDIVDKYTDKKIDAHEASSKLMIIDVQLSNLIIINKLTMIKHLLSTLQESINNCEKGNCETAIDDVKKYRNALAEHLKYIK